MNTNSGDMPSVNAVLAGSGDRFVAAMQKELGTGVPGPFLRAFWVIAVYVDGVDPKDLLADK